MVNITNDFNYTAAENIMSRFNISKAALGDHVMPLPKLEGVTSYTQVEEKPTFPQTFSGASKHLDASAFCNNLHNSISGLVPGYAMQLRQGGSPIQTFEWNWSKMPVDGDVGFGIDRRMHIASVSKLLTAIAMTKLLHDQGKSPFSTKIIDYLPKYWKKHSSIQQITFNHLMTHTSGFNTGGYNSFYYTMRNQVEAGVSKVGNFYYENMNFGLCRILLPIMNGDIPANAIVPPYAPYNPNLDEYRNNQFWELTTLNAYSQYLYKNVFSIASVTNATLAHPTDAALAYNLLTSTNHNGWDSGDFSSSCGGDGWHMSVNSVLNIMSAFRRGGTIMTPAQAQTMLDNKFGIDSITDTPAGKVYSKNGLWREDQDYRTEQCVALFLPEDMELVVFTNGTIDSTQSLGALQNLVINLYKLHLV
ncbi:MAG: beta-lactamase family protein [Desmonostoc vinosum HA7617-LM4]|jgi:CubicO group peptidase (beta-lactamase class C family)|nr:beta-lactamase family protein [Desmonostoc vinosum HA7617-LM4]